MLGHIATPVHGRDMMIPPGRALVVTAEATATVARLER